MTDKMYWALDIGHGSNTWDEYGAKGIRLPDGSVFEEHTFNSEVGILAKELAEYNRFKILLPQPPHSNEVGLTERTNLMNRENVYGVISIHANAGTHKANGSCCFYWHSSSEAKRLADIWVKNAKEYMSEVGLHGSSGQHASKVGSWTNLHICRETHMNALLIEHGFFTNPSDLKWIQSESYRKDCAETIVRTMCEFVGIEFKKPTEKKEQETNTLQLEQWQLNAVHQAITELGHKNIIRDVEGWKRKVEENPEQIIKDIPWLIFILMNRVAR